MSCVNLFAREGHVGLGTDARAIYFDDFFPSIRIFTPNKRKVSFISSFSKFLKISQHFRPLRKYQSTKESFKTDRKRRKERVEGKRTNRTHDLSNIKREKALLVSVASLKNHRCSRLRRSTSDFRVMYQTAYKSKRERERGRRRIFIKFFKRWIDFIRSYVVQITLRYAGAR